MLVQVSVAVMLNAFLASECVTPPDRYSTRWCKGTSTVKCVQAMIESYRDEYSIVNRALAEMLVVNPAVFLEAMSRSPTTLEKWLDDLEVQTFRTWAGSVDSELTHAANLRLRELMTGSVSEFVDDEKLGGTAREVLTRLRTTPVEVKEQGLTQN